MKNAFEKRPLCFAAVTAAAVMAAGTVLPLFVRCVLSFILLPAGAVLFFRLKKRYSETNLALTLAFVMSALSLISLGLGVDMCKERDISHAGEHSVSGYTLAVSSSSYVRDAVITEIDGQSVNIRATLKGEIQPLREMYVCFSAKGSLSPLDDRYGAGKGVYVEFSVSQAEKTGYKKGFFPFINQGLRQAFYDLTDMGGVLSCLFLGNRQDAPAALREGFARMGITHLLAVSGLHLAAVLGIFEAALYHLRGRKKGNYLALFALAVMYAGLTGFSGSVCRAAAMYLIARGGAYLIRGQDSITSLAMAVYLVTLLRPNSLFDMGFILSVSATAGIILAGAPLSDRICAAIRKKEGKEWVKKSLIYVSSSLTVSISALLFTLPAMVFMTGSINPLSPLYTLIFSPFVILILYICPPILLACHIPLLSDAAAGFTEAVLCLMQGLSDLLYPLAPAEISLSTPNVLPVTVLFLLSVLVLLYFTRARARAYCAASLAFLLALTSTGAIYGAAVSDRRELLVSAGELVCLVEGFDATLYSFGARGQAFDDMANMLRSRGITKINALYSVETRDRDKYPLTKAYREYKIKSIYVSDELICRQARAMGLFESIAVKNENLPYITVNGRVCGLDFGYAVFIHTAEYEACLYVKASDAECVVYGKNTANSCPVLLDSTYATGIYGNGITNYKDTLCIKLEKEGK